MDFISILLGFVLLVLGGDFLVRSSIDLSVKLNIPKIVIGLTVVSFATSAPELIVSLNAALSGSSALAINNVLGSNIANIGFVLGVTTLISTINVSKSFYKNNWPSMMLFTGVLYYMLINDKVLSRIEGSLLVLMLVGFTFYLIKFSNKQVELDEIESSNKNVSYFKILTFLLLGGTSLYFGSEFLVNGSVAVAKGYGVSEAVIGVSLIAVGTSIPELAASVIAAIKKEKAISLGNLIGSNIFNIGSVLGLTSIIKPIEIKDELILNRDIVWVIIFSALTLILAFIPKRNKLGVFKGSFLILLYAYFIYSILK